MPWTEKDYPNSFKNLDPIVRKKAIDIANAMLKEGYDEDHAIPIAISQAKKWADDASAEEKAGMEEKDVTRHTIDVTDNPSSRLQDSAVEVFFNEEKGKWAVRSQGAVRADSWHDTKKEALERAREMADKKDADVLAYTKEKSQELNQGKEDKS